MALWISAMLPEGGIKKGMNKGKVKYAKIKTRSKRVQGEGEGSPTPKLKTHLSVLDCNSNIKLCQTSQINKNPKNLPTINL